MADRYVDNATPGGNVSGYTSWANAALTITSIDSVDAAGDVIYLSSAHAETLSGSTYQHGWAGTPASPQKFLSVTKATPPTTLTFGAKITYAKATTAEHEWRGVGYAYGLHIELGGGTSRNAFRINPIGGRIEFEKCRIDVTGSWTGWAFYAASGFGAGGTCIMRNCDFKFANAGQYLNAGSWEIRGGSLLSGGTCPSTLFSVSGGIYISAFDLTNADSTMALFSMSANAGSKAIIRNSKLPASWTGSLVAGGRPSYPDGRAEMYNCDSGDTNYRLWIEDYAGYIVSDTGVYRDSGASDGTTPISWKMVTSANAEFPSTELASPEIARWNETTGSAITCTVEIVHNSQGSGTNGALKDDEIWLELMYLGTSGVPLGTWVRDCKADVLATAADQDTSSASWTGDSSGWDTQKLSVTITPQEKGFIFARVCMARASATVYVDPLITVS